MNRSRTLIVVLAIALAALVGYLYFYLGPYRRLGRERMELKTEIAGLRGSLTELDAAKAELAKRVDQAEELASKLEATVADLSEMQTEKDRATSEVEELRKTLATLEENTKTLSVESQELKRDLREKDLRVSDLEAEIKRLNSAHAERIQGLEDQISERDQEVKTLRTETLEFQEQVSALEHDREALTGESGRLARDLQESRGEMGELSRELAAKTEKLAGIEEAHQALLKRFAELAEEKDALVGETADLRNQLLEARARVRELSQGVATREEQLEEVQETHQKLIDQLRDQIQQKEVEISTLQERLSIRLLDKILFNPGNAVVLPEGRNVLKRVAEELKKLSDVQISVEGHTDDQPLSEASRAVYHDNLGLSAARAAAVARTLRTMGVSAASLSASGYSMYRPVASNNTPEGREQNRRVEIILTPVR